MSKTLMTIIGCSIIFIATALGSAIVFLLKKDFNKKLNSIICGFSAGVMIAASVWGLILPSIDYAENLGKWNFVPAVIGVLIGCFLVLLIDIIIHLINKKSPKLKNKPESFNKLTRFVVAFTFHNIPEGMAVGFAFGSAINSGTSAAFITAMGLAIGIAVQNIPEGAAVSLPVYKETESKKKGFFVGLLSGVVEPIFAVVGILLATQIKALLPWFLAFAAGAMMFVTIEDLIPEAKYSEKSHIGTWGFIVGFLLMMILDIALG